MNKLINPLLIILFAVLIRLMPHLPNFAPIGAMALFGGVYLSKKYALFVTLIALFVSDIFLGFHETMVFVYGSFLLTGIIGLWIKDHKNTKNIVLGAFVSSSLFFLITNFGVWIMGNWYPKNMAGLAECFTLALPFFRNTILGDLFYTGLFFSSYEIMLKAVAKSGKKVVENRVSEK